MTIERLLQEKLRIRNPGTLTTLVVKGAAGTGKTTQIPKIAEYLEEHGIPVTIVAPTNKAVNVLKTKDIDASTIASSLYEAQKTGRKKISKKIVIDPVTSKPKRSSINPKEFEYYDVEEDEYTYTFKVHHSKSCIIFDESSMISAQQWHDILHQFKGFAIFIGDHNQLPPIAPEEPNSTDQRYFNNPALYQKDMTCYNIIRPYHDYFTTLPEDLLLKTIYRQQSGSNIITLANDILAIRLGVGINLNPQNVVDAIVRKMADKQDQIYLLNNLDAYDIVLAYRNDVVDVLNSRVRQKKYQKEINNRVFPENHLPFVGDKLYVTQRHAHSEAEILHKGSSLVIREILETDMINALMCVKAVDDIGQVWDNLFIRLDFCGIKVNYKAQGSKQKQSVGAKVVWGYALTTHKAQGSQWDKVLLIDDGMFNNYGDKKSKRRWIYTGITRAAKKVEYVLWEDIRTCLGVRS